MNSLCDAWWPQQVHHKTRSSGAASLSLVVDTEDLLARRALAAEVAVLVERYRHLEDVVPRFVLAFATRALGRSELHESIVRWASDNRSEARAGNWRSAHARSVFSQLLANARQALRDDDVHDSHGRNNAWRPRSGRARRYRAR